ncbi:DUF488 domain-containing protein [Pedobacter sp. MR2016-19]|uniref:DUF488 domain-containing protein n=1 Tax=Pedobacter sp. MR2016-19 TaxID=2780089 RepID=UPI001876D159|nr:DUF488 domain-containing protein [Pedobacter sp. MR2016-19]MBE5321206.1 DUF488 domain-containing protein [Pedobacter sp. MR2016-19]
MKTKSLYTIGHGSRKTEDFLSTLKQFSIDFLIDVRSKPYSKFNPQYNQLELKTILENNGIRYVFMGDSIGGRPKDPTCYDEEGKVNYDKVKEKEFFLKGIDRLKLAYEKGVKAIIMCSESKPCECHRSKLIGRVLESQHINLQHIDEKGKVKDQAIVIRELNKGFSDTDLFGSSANTRSRKAYL